MDVVAAVVGAVVVVVKEAVVVAVVGGSGGGVHLFCVCMRVLVSKVLMCQDPLKQISTHLQK